MTSDRGRNWRDVIGGLLMVAIGLFWALWAQEHYRLGTTTRMGPGWFPMHLGYVLAVIGALITLPALIYREEGKQKPMVIEWRPMIMITASVLVFAATVKWIGLAPAIFLQIGLCVLADTKLGIAGTLILAALTSIACHFIFYVGLDVQLPPFVWPFQ